MSNKLIVSAAHYAPEYLDAASTTKKVVDAIGIAKKQNSKLVAFPESFLPGFPIWNAIGKPINNHDFFAKFVENSIRIDGPEIKAISASAKKNSIIVSVGFSERVSQSVGCLFNSNIIINENGEIINHHRKIVPTFFEKLTWSNGDSHGLKVVDTKIGKIGVTVHIPVPVAYHSFGGWKRSLFGDHSMHGPEGVRFYTKLKTATVTWVEDNAGPEFTIPVLS